MKTNILTIKPDGIIFERDNKIVRFRVTLLRNSKAIDEVYYLKIGDDKSCFYIEGDNIKLYSNLPDEKSQSNTRKQLSQKY